MSVSKVNEAELFKELVECFGTSQQTHGELGSVDSAVTKECTLNALYKQKAEDAKNKDRVQLTRNELVCRGLSVEEVGLSLLVVGNFLPRLRSLKQKTPATSFQRPPYSIEL